MKRHLSLTLLALLLSAAAFAIGPITGIRIVCVGSTTTLSDTTSGGRWTSVNPSVATIGSSSGIVTGVTPGVDTIIYTAGTSSVTTTVTVNPLPPYITGIFSCCVGQTSALHDSTSGYWTSSNPSVATVGATSGLVSGVAPGITTITFTAGGTYCSRSVSFTVNPLPAAITGPSTVTTGGTITLSDGTSGGTWSSSTTSVATIGSTGIVTGVGLGTTTITYMLSTGCYVTMHVSDSAGTSISAISGSSIVCTGSTTALTDSTTGGTWSSSNTSVATVGSSTGIVTGVATGTVTITYTVGSAHTTFAMTVSAASSISGPNMVCVGQTISLTGSPSGGAWFSGSSTIASVSTSGVVTGVATGSTNIYYNSGGCYSYHTVTVTAVPAAITGTMTVTSGGTTTLSDAVGGGTWSSSNTSIATISSIGVVTGVASGTCTITYSTGGCYVTATVTVSGTSIAAISGSSSVCVGQTITLTDATSGGTWSSGSVSIATVGSTTGIVTGILAGTATISYTVGSSHVTKIITVNANPATITGTTTVSVGGTTTLSDATSGGSWSSSNTTIATINATSGLVTGVSAGTCTITYMLSTGCYSTTTVTVTGTTSISSISGASSVCVGSTITLFDSTSGGSWSSSNTSVATVSSIGVVTGVAAGTCTITYTVGSSYVTHAITVNAAPSTITGTTTTTVGGTSTLSDSPTGGTWSSSNTSIATVNPTSGVVTGVSVGTCNITYTLSDGCYRIVGFSVTGSTSISSIIGSSSVCVGSTITLFDSTTGGSWSSSNTSVATVSSIGVVTGVAAGTVTITYTVGSSYVTHTVVVNPLPSTITGSTTVAVGSTITLADATGGGVWSSSNTSIATVNATTGVVTGVSAGTCTITYTLTTGCYRTVTITVTGGTSIHAIIGVSSVCAGSTIALTDSTPGGSWSSSNTSIATVTSGGLVTGVASGTVTITYTVGSSYVTHTMTVTSGAMISGGSVICAGSTLTLTGSPSGGTWASGSVSIATVGSLTGVVTGVTSGIVNIYYSDGGCYAYHTVTVNASASISGSSTVCVGSTTALTPSVGGGTWSSSNTSIATVSTTGVVTGVATGVVNIYYLSGGCYAYHTVTVNAMASISGSSTVCSGSTITLTASISGGTWSSSNTSVATVGSTGVVTGVAGGTATIYYNDGGCYAYHLVTVNAAAVISGSHSLCVGNTETLTGSITGGAWFSGNTSIATINTTTGLLTAVAAGVDTIYYHAGSCYSTFVVTVSAMPSISGGSVLCAGTTTTLTATPSGGSWSSSNTSVATVTSTGVVTAVGSGTVNIYYNNGGCYAYHTMTVNGSPATISGGSSVCVGSTIALTASPTGGTWSSGNTSVATVSTTGVVTGVGSGVVNIYYLIDGCYAYHTVTVNAAAAITGSGAVCVGSTTTLGASISGGSWSSSNTSVATVGSSTGVVTGIAAGTATIYYHVGTCYSYMTVTVTASASISGSSDVCTGGTITLTGSPSGGSWSSGNTSIATVSSTGVVTGVGGGLVNIYYTSGGCSAYHTVSVNAASSTISGATSLCAGSTTTLTGSPSGGSWASSFTLSATINTSGVVTGIGAGTTTIYYSVGGCYAYRTETVYATPAAITGSDVICVGSSTTLADVTPGGTWSSSSTSVATVTTAGVVTGVSAGTSTIEYALSSCSASTVVTVNPLPATITGGTTVMVTYGLALSDAVTGGTWLSGNTSIATVNPTTGLVIGVSAGTVNIYYTVGGCSTYITITVTDIPLTPMHSGTSGVGSITTSGNDVKIYPNPTTGILNIQWDNQQEGTADMTVTDVTGREVMRSAIDITSASGQKQVDLSNLKDGLYMISIRSGSVYFTGKLMITK